MQPSKPRTTTSRSSFLKTPFLFSSTSGHRGVAHAECWRPSSIRSRRRWRANLFAYDPNLLPTVHASSSMTSPCLALPAVCTAPFCWRTALVFFFYLASSDPACHHTVSPPCVAECAAHQYIAIGRLVRTTTDLVLHCVPKHARSPPHVSGNRRQGSTCSSK